MIIPSPLITLDYNPVKDVLFVEWPDVQNHSLAEVSYSLKDIINTLKFYDVKHLLIDSRKTVIGIGSDEYARIATDFKKELLRTRVQKVARIESGNKAREAQVKELSQTKMPIAFQSFSDVDSALLWLES